MLKSAGSGQASSVGSGLMSDNPMETTSAFGSQEPAADADPLVGKIVATRYRVIKKLGEGGMGTVYLAEHITIEKKIALKVLLHEYARKADLKERFLREAKAAASIGHENIIDITDFGDTPDGSVFFAMEFLEGSDLSHVVKREGPIPWARAKPILLQICRALGAAHAKNIIHRDMKPENIYLIEREGRPDFVKVLDFGIAKVSGVGDTEHRLTRTGMIFGTPEYMSPEQAQGHLPDHRVDIYAVGVIMYELLTGAVPFKADTFMGILTKHIFENPVPPTQLKPDLQIPVEAESVILKAMAKDRDERFNSLAEMAAAIQGVSNRLTRSTADHVPTPNIMTPGPGGGRVLPTVGPHRATVGAVPGRVAEPVEVGAEPAAFGPSKGKLIGIILVVLLLVGGGIAVALTMGGDKSNGDGKGTAAVKGTSAGPGTGDGTVAGTAAKPAPTMVTVRLRSDPPGATVKLGMKAVGQTPVDYQVEKTSNSMLFTFSLPGHETMSESVVPDKEGVQLKATLKKDAPVKPVTPTKVEKPKTPVAVKRPKRPIRWPKTKVVKPKTKVVLPKPKVIKPTTKVDKGDLKNPFAPK